MKTAKKEPCRVLFLLEHAGKLERADVRRVWHKILNERMGTVTGQRKLARAA